ncbi:TPA: SAM-dependent methyltransferase, partial [Klebsiella pneumoniae]
SSYEALRGWLLNNKTFITMAHLGARAFGQISGEVVQTTVWVVNNNHTEFYRPVFFRLINGSEEEKKSALISRKNMFNHTLQNDFKKIPGSPIAYWLSENMRNIFTNSTLLGSLSPVKQGLATANNDVFLRLWTEISSKKLNPNCESIKDSITSKKKWFPYNKGGDYRKYYGNKEFVVNWENDGYEIKNFTDISGKVRSRAQNTDYFFKPSITWSFVSSAYFGVRYCENGSIFDVGGSSTFPKAEDHYWLTVFLCSKQVFEFMKIMNPTLNFQVGNIASLPIINSLDTATKEILNGIGKELVEIHK